MVVDPAADAVVGGAVNLGAGCPNASGMALLGNTLWIGCGYVDYNSGKPVGGGLLPVDVSGATPVPGTVIPLAHAIGSVAVCGGQIYAGASDTGALLKLDPAAGLVASDETACPANAKGYSAVFDVACAK